MGILTRKLALTYLALVGAPLTLLVLVMRFGGGMSARHAVVSGARVAAQQDVSNGLSGLATLILQLGAIILTARVLGKMFERLRQPRVIGEVMAGILLGPSLLAWVAPSWSALLFPPASFVVLNAIGQLGLIVFMFMVGLELDLNELRRRWPIAVVISHGSIGLAMTLGGLLAIYLYPRLADPSAGFTGFALFMGVAMSITAFPVLARILTERGLLQTRLGSLAISCAAVDDVSGWCVLAYVIGYVRSSHSSVPFAATLLGLPLFLAVMFLGGRRILGGIASAYRRHGALSGNYQALLLLLLLASALVTEFLGLHPLFGAFIAGVVVPKDVAFVSYIREKFDSFTTLLLPLFFAYTGLRTNIGSVRGIAGWAICALIIATAIAGKFGGVTLGARLSGSGWRHALSLGTLMNTRGLMELVVLNIGLDIHILSRELFSMLVLMAIGTTMMTTPMLEALNSRVSVFHRAGPA